MTNKNDDLLDWISILTLLRIAVVWNILIACNRASVDYLITSSLMDTINQWLYQITCNIQTHAI